VCSPPAAFASTSAQGDDGAECREYACGWISKLASRVVDRGKDSARRTIPQRTFRQSGDGIGYLSAATYSLPRAAIAEGVEVDVNEINPVSAIPAPDLGAGAEG
jgi:hypothetical protein